MALKSSSNRSIQDDLKEISKMTNKDMIGGPIKFIIDSKKEAQERTDRELDMIGYRKKK